MTDAREIMAQAQADYWENPSIPEGYLPMVDHVLAVLTSAGLRFAGPDDRILGPDEIDGPTVEKCAIRAKECFNDPQAEADPEYVSTAIRALKEKRT